MTTELPVYPQDRDGRDRWVLAQRGSRASVSAAQPYAFLVEEERFADGTVGDVATIFLTNRECPWRCVMCDLWQNTLPEPVAPGDIPRQIEYALERLKPVRQVKLYNSGSFFDRGAIPAADYALIAALLQGFESVIVECHPTLVSEECRRFQENIGCQLEIAMGLETAHPAVLAKLNKRMTLDDYSKAANALQKFGVALRSFVLVQPPFLSADESYSWSCRSVDFAQKVGATVVSLIPTRGGNGAMEQLARAGAYAPPTVQLLEAVHEYGIERDAGRVFADTWDFAKFAKCAECRSARLDRMQRMNRTQQVEPRIHCEACA